jgi:hypothetical protein
MRPRDHWSVCRMLNLETNDDVNLIISPSVKPTNPTRLPSGPDDVFRWGRTFGSPTMTTFHPRPIHAY